MGRVLAALLPLAIVVAVSPVPIVAVVLMLLTPRAGTAGAGFLGGWVVGIAGTTTAVLLLAGDPAPGGGDRSSGAASWMALLLGVLLVALAARQWRSRPAPGEEPVLPRWLAAVDRVTAVRAGALGLALSAVNPKNLLVCIAAGVVIADASLSAAEDTRVVLLFTGAAVSTVAVPVLAHAVGRRRMSGPLARLRDGLVAHDRAVTAGLLLVIGVVLLGQGSTAVR
jgi:threonine/homoserine/homoserine lactone efflux protein